MNHMTVYCFCYRLMYKHVCIVANNIFLKLYCSHLITNKIVIIMRFYKSQTSKNKYTRRFFTNNQSYYSLSFTECDSCNTGLNPTSSLHSEMHALTTKCVKEYTRRLFTILLWIQIRFTHEAIIITIKLFCYFQGKIAKINTREY